MLKILVAFLVWVSLFPLTTTANTSPVYSIYSLEELVYQAESIIIGKVARVNERMERVVLNGIISPIRTVNIIFKEVEVLRGDPSKRTIKQYASHLSSVWNVGETLMVLSQKPTELGFDRVPGGSILKIEGENARGIIVYKDVIRDTVPLQQIRDLIRKSW